MGSRADWTQQSKEQIWIYMYKNYVNIFKKKQFYNREKIKAVCPRKVKILTDLKRMSNLSLRKIRENELGNTFEDYWPQTSQI